MRKPHLLTLALLSTLSLATPSRAADDAPTLTLDKNRRIVAYQLKRHTNPQLVAIERKPDDPKFKPVYEALLTRKGLEKKYREEAVAALVQIDKSEPVAVLLEGIANVDPEDKTTPRELAALLMAQKPAALADQKERLQGLARESESPSVKQAAYAALCTAAGAVDNVWRFATENDGIKPLLAALPLIPNPKVRETFYAKVKEQIDSAPDPATQVAAIEAFGSVSGHEADQFQILGAILAKESGDKQAAAVRAIARIPASKWPKDQAEAVAQSIVKLVEKADVAQRTQPAVVQAVQLGNDLAGALPADKAAPIRKSLRELAVRVILVHTLVEQMMYDLHYFTVQAGKPVQVILDNGDTMPHNLVITAPGAFQQIAITAGAMAPPDDPKAKPFVPDDPKVLQATHLVQPGESENLSFTAPAKPGNYTFLCTYPGHWVKMYGTMQVVADLDAYDQNPVTPKDPLTHKPYETQKNEGLEGVPPAEHKH